jgi:hypothetical protein
MAFGVWLVTFYCCGNLVISKLILVDTSDGALGLCLYEELPTGV